MWKPYLALVGSVWIWGFSNISLKHLLAVMPPTVVAFFGATLTAVALWSVRGRQVARELRAGRWGLLFCGGLFGTFGFNFLHNIGLQQTTAINATLIVATMPVFGLLASHLLRETRITPLSAFGCLASVTGAAYLVTRGSLLTVGYLQWHAGDLYIVGAVASLVGYAVCVKHARHIYSPVAITALQVTVGAFLFLPFAAAERFWVYLPRFDSSLIGAVIYVGLFRSIGGNLCYTYAIRHVPIATATLTTNVIPLVTALFACWLLNERLEWTHGVAGLLILSGATMAARGQQKGRVGPRPVIAANTAAQEGVG